MRLARWLFGLLAIFAIGTHSAAAKECSCRQIEVEDVAPYSTGDTPIRAGPVVFVWRPTGATPTAGSSVHAVANVAEYNGFMTGYRLDGVLRDERAGPVLSIADLRDVRIAYTDDLIEAGVASGISTTALIARLYDPDQRAEWALTEVPGGEVIEFSSTMKQLILRGDDSRRALEERLDDKAIQNEVVLVLGAIGNKATIPMRISRFPDVDPAAGARGPGDADALRRVCFTFALTHVTRQPIGRSREGTDFSSGMRDRWHAWWTNVSVTYRLPADEVNATWYPSYPQLTPEWARRSRDEFAKGR